MDVNVLDGELQAGADASAARLLGLTCFETIAFDDATLLDGEEHLERLAQSARTLGLGPRGGWEAVDEAIETAMEATGHEDGILRVSLHATGEPTGLSLEDPTAQVQVLVRQPRYDDLTGGVRAVTSTFQAPGEDSWPAHVKAPCLPRYLAHREAQARGAFEALMLDAHDGIVSGTRSNVFAVVDGQILTPPTPPALPGITRRRVLDALQEDIVARRIPRGAMDEATEAWLTFTGPGIVPIQELDGAPLSGSVPGPVTKTLLNELPPSR